MNAINGLGSSTATGEDIDNLEEKIDDLAENNGAFQIIRAPVLFANEEGVNDEIRCVSDHDYKLYVSVTGSGDSSVDRIEFSSATYHSTHFRDLPFSSFVIGGLAGELMTMTAMVFGDSNGIIGEVVLETADGATAS